MNVLQRLLIISRPVINIPAVALFVAGVGVSGSPINWLSILGALYFIVPMGLIIYGINDIADRESDEQNARKGGVDGAVVSIKETKPILMGVALSFLSFFIILLVTKHFASSIAWLVILIFGYTYSVKPFRLKTRPGIDSLSNGIWLVSVILTGYWLGSTGLSILLFPLHILLACILCGAAAHALGTMPDYDVDKKAGDVTIGVWLGKTRTYLVCAAAFAIGGILLSSHLSYIVFFATASIASLFGLRYNSPKAARRIGGSIALLLPVIILTRFLFRI